MLINVLLGICFAYQLAAQAVPSSKYSYIKGGPTVGIHSGYKEQEQDKKTNGTIPGHPDQTSRPGLSNLFENSSYKGDSSDAGVPKIFHDLGIDEKNLPSNLIGGYEVPVPTYIDGNREAGIDKPMALKSSSVQKIWHVGIYNKVYTPFMQICGGTLVTTKAVISAAHCFWIEKVGASPARQYAVAAGKRYRPWHDVQDTTSQKSDVAAIHIPIRYQGSDTSYQDDIAVLLLVLEFTVNEAVKPACVNFDIQFDNEQLQDGSTGMILGWGLTSEDGDASPVLNYLELPTVSIEKCLSGTDKAFLRYITSDKICAGVTEGKAKSLCRGDSGGGLVFAALQPAPVPYLRAVASTAPRNDHKCNARALAALTHVRAHRDFLLRHIPDLEEQCEKHFSNVEDRNKEHETKTETPSCGQPVQFICNCFCNNKDPVQDKIVFYD